VAGQRCSLCRDAFLQVAVGADRVDVVVDQIELGLVELAGHTSLGDCHTHRVCESLSQRAGRGLDAGGEAVLGMAGSE
jgi:hypothetical protein